MGRALTWMDLARAFEISEPISGSMSSGANPSSWIA